MDPNTRRNLVCNKNGILFREENGGFLYTLLGQLGRQLEKNTVVTISNTVNQKEFQMDQ